MYSSSELLKMVNNTIDSLPYDRKKIDTVLHYMVNEGHILMKDGKVFAQK